VLHPSAQHIPSDAAYGIPQSGPGSEADR